MYYILDCVQQILLCSIAQKRQIYLHDLFKPSQFGFMYIYNDVG